MYSFGIGYFVLYDDGEIGFFLSLWPLSLLLGAAGTFALRSGILARRRALGNKCKSCDYDLTGLAAGAVCPECGKGRATPALE